MSSRFIKQFIYGAAYLLVLGVFVFGVYLLFFQPTGTCFDNKKNQNETGIDCGGSCVACEIKNLVPIEMTSAEYLAAGNLTSVVATLTNPNPDYGTPSFSYTLDIWGPFGSKLKTITGQTFIFPGEIKQIVFPGLSVNSKDVSKVELKLETPTQDSWRSKSNFSIPKVQIRQVVTSQSGADLAVSGIVTSQETLPLSPVTIGATFYNNMGLLVGASKTELDRLEPFGEKQFQIKYPAISNINLQATKVFISTKREQ